MKMFLLLLCILSVVCNSAVFAVDCVGLPDTNELKTQLNQQVISAGGEGGLSLVIRSGPYYTCQVQGTTMGTYQELSVILEYTDGGGDKVGQFELYCHSGVWDSVSDTLMIGVDTDTELWTNCSSCTGSAGNPQHCQTCNSACNVGLMRCTGSGSDDCCVAFEENGDCLSNLNCPQDNFVANKSNGFTCACGLSCSDGYTLNSTSCTCYLTDICQADTPCDNNGVCTLGSTPDQYTCNCTGTGFTGTNCTVCPDCPVGYSLITSNCSCYQSHICLVDDPCSNGGYCTIQDGDYNYTCNCIGNYDGTNCTECVLVCQEGYEASSDCTECLLADICLADNPCDNNGSCMLDTTPDEYTCNCTGTGYTGANCTECGLSCSNGGSPVNCSSCDCGLMYTGTFCDTPINYCTNNKDSCGIYGTCINDYVNKVYTCSCSDGWAGPDCTQCTIEHCNDCTGDPPVCRSCNDDYVISPSGLECLLRDLCPLMPCHNNATCRGVPGSYRCDCPQEWTGVNCTTCAEGFGNHSNSCVPCAIINCRDCYSNHESCTVCENGYYLNSRLQCLRDPDNSVLIWIIVGSVVGGFLVLILVIIIVMASIRVAGHNEDTPAKIAKRKSTFKKANIVNNNPLYVSTDDLKDIPDATPDVKEDV